MASLGEWWEEHGSGPLGAALSLALVAAAVGGLGWVAMRAVSGAGGRGSASEFEGRKLSDLKLKDADGRIHTLGELKGKVVVLDFWATWCPPCRMSLPELKDLQKRQGSDYAVVPVSLDQGGFQDVLPFQQEHPEMTLFAVIPAEPSRLRAQVGAITGIPTTLIVDRKGTVVKAWSGYAEGKVEQELRAELKR